MANTLRVKRGLSSTIPQGQIAEPLFTTDTYDLYIGKGSGGNQRFQKYIASGTSSQFLKGDGSLDSTSYQPLITAGTTLQYYRGDKTFQTLNTSVVPESGAIYFTEPRVLATVLTGLNLSGGGTIAATDSVLTAFGKVQNQISALVGGATYQGTWNASTNSPALSSGTGTKGYYYVVSVAGSTNLDGITDWKVGDWAIFNGTTWDKVDNTDAVSSVNGFTGAVNLGLGNLNDVTLSSPTNTQLLRFNGTSSKWENWTPTYISAAITSLNGLTAATQTFATGTTGTDFTISSSTSTHTFNIPSASATSRGLLTSGDYNTFAGKQSQITLTTTGTSGAATFVASTLNIPQYQAALTNPVTGTGTINQIAYFNATGSTIASLSTATYPSLTELSYVKGVTSSIQTQLNGKQATLTNPVTGTGTTDYIPQFTGTSAIGNSIIQVYSTNQIGVGSTPFNSGARFVIDDSNLSFTPLLVKSGYTGAIANLAGLKLYRYDYSTGTDGIGIAFDQTNSSSSQTTYAAMYGYPQTRTAGSEGGLFRIYNKRAGTNTIALEIDENGNAFMNTKIMKLNTSTSFGTADSYIVLNEPTAAATAGLLLSTNSTLRSYLTSSNAGTTLGVVSGSGPFYINVAASNVLTIAQSGAATFSSSVTVSGSSLGGTAIDSLRILNGNDGGGNLVIQNFNSVVGKIGVITEDVGSGTFNDGIFKVQLAADAVLQDRLTITSRGAATFNSSAAKVMEIQSSTASGGYVRYTYNGTTSIGYIGSSSQLSGLGAVSDLELRADNNLILTTTSGQLRITSGGAINIGTSSATGGIRFQRGSSTGQIGYVTSDIPGYSDMAGITFNAENVTGGAQAGSIRFNTSNAATSAERMRLTNAGYLKASSNSTYVDVVGSYHELRGNGSNGYELIVSNVNTTPASQYVISSRFSSSTPNNTSARFLDCEDSTATRAYIRSNGGFSNYQANDTNLSDIRTKKDIISLESYWDKFKAIEVVKFKYKDQTHDDYNIGVIAQQVESVAPEFIDADGWGETKEDESPLKSVYTSDLHHATIKVLQEAMAKIEEQQAQIEELKQKLS